MSAFMPGEWEAQNPQAPTDDITAQLELKRRLARADALRNAEMPQAQMVGGRYITPSWTQYLANAYGKMQAGADERAALKQYGDIQATKQQKLGSLLEDLSKGKEVTTPVDYNEAGNMPGMEQTTYQPYSQKEFMAKTLKVMPELAPKFLESQFAQYAPKKPIELGAGGKLLDPTTYATLASNPKEGAKYTNIQQDKAGNTFGFNTETQKFEQVPGVTMATEKWSEPYMLNGQSVQKNLTTGEIKQAVHLPNQITNAPVFKQEGAESATVGKGFGEQYLDIQKTGLQAPGKVAKYARLGSLIEGVNTGKLTPLGTDIAATAASLGFNIDKKLGNKQAAEALSNSIALELRSTSEGGGMPGAMSDADREYLKAMVPNIGKTPEANKLMIEAATKIAQRQQEVARLARDYRTRHGHIDEGFYNDLQTYSDSHPLFSGAAPASNQGGGATMKWNPEKGRLEPNNG